MSSPVTGTGIHGGRPTRVWLHRDDGPLRFASRGAVVPADVGAVVATDRCTVLGRGAARIAVVEHLLAACHVAGFWSGLLIEVDGDELPILDGSAAPWTDPLAELGPPPAAPAPLVATTPWRWRDGLTEIEVRPGPASIDVCVSYDHPAVGTQRWRGGTEAYAGLLAARTFGFEDDLDRLRARGLALGAVMGSGVLFGAAGPSSPLRGADEPVRHKALDAVGDLVLLGRPLAAAIRIRRGSHRAHVAVVRHLRRTLGQGGGTA